MSVIEGTTSLKEWKGSYDFAVDGGVVGYDHAPLE
jgi:hypothetical protein